MFQDFHYDERQGIINGSVAQPGSDKKTSATIACGSVWWILAMLP
jgi:hypothetical protein